jgi:hypothetical protein
MRHNGRFPNLLRENARRIGDGGYAQPTVGTKVAFKQAFEIVALTCIGCCEVPLPFAGRAIAYGTSDRRISFLSLPLVGGWLARRPVGWGWSNDRNARVNPHPGLRFVRPTLPRGRDRNSIIIRRANAERSAPRFLHMRLPRSRGRVGVGVLWGRHDRAIAGLSAAPASEQYGRIAAILPIPVLRQRRSVGCHRPKRQRFLFYPVDYRLYGG